MASRLQYPIGQVARRRTSQTVAARSSTESTKRRVVRAKYADDIDTLYAGCERRSLAGGFDSRPPPPPFHRQRGEFVVTGDHFLTALMESPSCLARRQVSELRGAGDPDKNTAEAQASADRHARAEQSRVRNSAEPADVRSAHGPSEKRYRQEHADSVHGQSPIPERGGPAGDRPSTADSVPEAPRTATRSRAEGHPESAETRSRDEYADALRGPREHLGEPDVLPKPERITVDGHEIEVTHDPADGVWIGGLPGEVPDPIGDLLVSPGEVHAEVPVSVPGSPQQVPQHEIETGSAVTAVLTLGMMGWAAGEWVARKVRGFDDDAGH